MQKQSELYRGKSKTVYHTEKKDYLIIKFRDEISANNGIKVKQLSRKGTLNNKINYFIMTKLQENGIPTHIEELISKNEVLVKNLKMIPVEFVLRNLAEGSLVKRLNIQKGTILNPPIFELFLKNDVQCDPMINESYCETFGWINKNTLIDIHMITLKINKVLSKLFSDIGIILVDFKLEFGMIDNQIVLGDEFSPDTARLWNKENMEKMDKDLFREDSGEIIQAYESVGYRLGIEFN
ncbi:phosphoribosylaminoimidazolesuccinocarboxamide synthase [Candidatus Pantoea edessiphila]|uniref:Phosphoribosylaminoimidazole-succinocarboxamide synthase n=1 Tax=Candidatus Pantoea edessiphila TaxID=2044610 RepID=A0A2P5SWJ2_9GAMM|nr:phosphoribosylaminoimidazolesuccinocarboxamide synthase [Candidatus Pantoea edessiphila]PPI86692.1 phosphoribosylaminoimidazolesuccinocarboxamide synthase [Candidatus Pantoea edessiphila]